MKDQKIVVWFSCGAASAVAAKKTIEKYGADNTVIVVNSPVIEEDEDNRRFFNDVQDWIGQKIELAINENYPDCSAVTVWDKRKYMSGTAGAPCTVELKKEARYQWEEKNKPDWHVLGFTANEQERHDRFIVTEIPNVIPVLIDERLRKSDCFDIIKSAGIALPRIYALGYPNANCIGCVKATSPTYWNHVRKVHPEVFEQRAEQSRRIGTRLVRVKNERLFLDELPIKARGGAMKKMSFQCGIFCEITN